MQSIKQSMLRLRKGVAKFGGKKPNKAAIKLPLRDGDIERDDEAYKGHYFINANSTTAPQIVDRAVNLSWTEVKYIPDAMQEYLLTSMHLTQMEIRGLPAVLEIFRRLEMVSLSVARPLQQMTSEQ